MPDARYSMLDARYSMLDAQLIKNGAVYYINSPVSILKTRLFI